MSVRLPGLLSIISEVEEEKSAKVGLTPPHYVTPFPPDKFVFKLGPCNSGRVNGITLAEGEVREILLVSPTKFCPREGGLRCVLLGHRSYSSLIITDTTIIFAVLQKLAFVSSAKGPDT